MIFSEIYSCYFSTVSKIISKAVEGDLDDKTLKAIVQGNAFAESIVDIPAALKSGRWPLLFSDNSTVIADTPQMPLTVLEKRWLKSLVSDPRAKLFDISAEGLEDVEPLYPQDAFVRFDAFADGDPFEDAVYIGNFRKILSATRSKTPLSIRFTDSRGNVRSCVMVVDNLEYSSKNDRFRAVGTGDKSNITVNLASVMECEIFGQKADFPQITRNKKELVAELTDVNNALERAMISFSYLEKETSKIDENRYIFKLRYYEEDEAEILIQILSFGTNLRVLSPSDFILKIKNRINKQRSFV